MFNKYYFSFGSDPLYPYQNGYIVIEAKNIEAACDIFKAYHPNREGSNLINCAFIYTEDEFMKSWDRVWKYEPCHGRVSYQTEV